MPTSRFYYSTEDDVVTAITLRTVGKAAYDAGLHAARATRRIDYSGALLAAWKAFKREHHLPNVLLTEPIDYWDAWWPNFQRGWDAASDAARISQHVEVHR